MELRAASADGAGRRPAPITGREDVLRVFLEEEPSARSPYGLYGFPPMWRVATIGDAELFARPGRTMIRDSAGRWIEADGVHWQLREGSAWTGQGYQGTVEQFLEALRAWRTEAV